MLTGDKVETAINIGSSSGLLESDMALIKFVSNGDSPSKILKKLKVLPFCIYESAQFMSDTQDDSTIRSVMEEMAPMLGAFFCEDDLIHHQRETSLRVWP